MISFKRKKTRKKYLDVIIMYKLRIILKLYINAFMCKPLPYPLSPKNYEVIIETFIKWNQTVQI